MNRSAHLLIADDTLTAQCLQRLLEVDFPGVEIATCAAELFAAAQAHTPDVVLLDIKRPALDGFDAMRRLRELSPTTKLIVVTMQDEAEYAAEALRAGASGYVLKWCAVAELVTAIQAVLNGHSYLTPSLKKGRSLMGVNGKSRPSGRSLTLRQREVLLLVAQGRTAKEIANALGLSVKTAVFHKMSIMDKLGLRTTADLTRYALDHGMLSSTAKTESMTPSLSMPLLSDSVPA